MSDDPEPKPAPSSRDPQSAGLSSGEYPLGSRPAWAENSEGRTVVAEPSGRLLALGNPRIVEACPELEEHPPFEAAGDDVPTVLDATETTLRTAFPMEAEARARAHRREVRRLWAVILLLSLVSIAAVAVALTL